MTTPRVHRIAHNSDIILSCCRSDARFETMKKCVETLQTKILSTILLSIRTAAKARENLMGDIIYGFYIQRS